MPSDKATRCFSDIVEAIGLIEAWVADAGGPEPAVLADLKTRSAIERQLLVISEAANRLHKLDAALAGALAPGVDWRGIRGIGNFLRHKYDDLDTALLVQVVGGQLTELRSACQNAVARLTQS